MIWGISSHYKWSLAWRPPSWSALRWNLEFYSVGFSKRNDLALGISHRINPTWVFCMLFSPFDSRVMLTSLAKSLSMNAQKGTLRQTHISTSPLEWAVLLTMTFFFFFFFLHDQLQIISHESIRSIFQKCVYQEYISWYAWNVTESVLVNV